MNRINFASASTGSLSVLLLVSTATAQQNLPTIEVGNRGRPTLHQAARSNGAGGGQQAARSNGEGEGEGTRRSGPVVNEASPGPVGMKIADPTAYAVPNSSLALKTNTPILQTPFSVQVVPQQVLQDQQATRIEDAVKNVSGVQLPWTGGIYQDFVIRGFGTNYTQYRNGVRLQYYNMDMANIDRVEVLKGPAAMLYGRTDPGGMINIVTKQPQATPSAYLQQQFGNYNYYRTTLGATGSSKDGAILYRFDGAYLNSGSFRDFISKENVFIAPSVTFRPTPDDDINVNLEYQDGRAVGDNGIPAIYRTIANVPINRNYSNPGFGKDPINSRLIDGSWTHRFNENFKVRSGATASWVNYTFRDNPVAYFQFDLEDSPSPTVRRGIYFENFWRNTVSTFVDFTGKFETGPLRHEVLVGGNYYGFRQSNNGYFGLNALFDPVNPEDWFTNVSLYNPIYPALPFGYFDARRKFAPNDFGLNKDEWASIYFQDQIDVNDYIHLLGGGRYDWSLGIQGVSMLPVTARDSSIIRTDRFSPKAGVVFTPLPYMSIYGSYAEGFGSNNFGRSATGSVLPPETSYQWEWGVKSELFDKRVITTLAFYELTKENVAVLAGDGSTFDAIGAARSRGVEFDFQGKVTDALSVIASYAYTDARYLRTGLDDDHLGRRLPGAAPSAGSIWAKYDFQQPQLAGLSLGAGVFAASSQAGDKGYSPYYYSLPSYARVDMMAAYKFDYLGYKTSAQLNINNVNNVKYFAPCLPYNCSKAYNGVGEPLMVKGALKVEF